MTRFYYGSEGEGKLVRDKLPDVIRAEKHIVKTLKLDNAQLATYILEKMPEEIAEIKEALGGGDKSEVADEIADLQTLIDSLVEIVGIDKADVDKIKQKKTGKKGAFINGAYIEYVELNPNGDDYGFWLDHFRKNADRYKERK
jgi:predicted house-cleaning noncanonical NTP pyrophosphatase (MazG superfamily)